MLFQVYGDNAIYQWIGWILVFCCLIGANELARRTKTGGVIAFLVIPAVLTVYFITVYTAAAMGADWALNNPTYVHMTSWFHYAKLYAATIGCIGFMALKYKWGSIGKSHWFKCFPFVIVAINILIAVVSDFESAIRGWGTTWISTEGVTLYGGWHNVFNGVAGLLNIFCMTGWFGIYASKKKDDMLWPDMTWVFIVAYDLWNFCYTYNCHPPGYGGRGPGPGDPAADALLVRPACGRRCAVQPGHLGFFHRDQLRGFYRLPAPVPHVPSLRADLWQLSSSAALLLYRHISSVPAGHGRPMISSPPHGCLTNR